VCLTVTLPGGGAAPFRAVGWCCRAPGSGRLSGVVYLELEREKAANERRTLNPAACERHGKSLTAAVFFFFFGAQRLHGRFDFPAVRPCPTCSRPSAYKSAHCLDPHQLRPLHRCRRGPRATAPNSTVVALRTEINFRPALAAVNWAAKAAPSGGMGRRVLAK